MDISFQLYSSRDVASQTALLGDLAEYGYAQVEGFGGVYDDPAGFRAALDTTGLTMPSGHFALDDLENDFDNCAAVARTLGMRLIVAPYLDAQDRPTDRAGYKDLAQRLQAVGTRAAQEGFQFAWHNHDFELQTQSDGSIPLEILLGETEIGWEADLAWIVRADADPAAWLQEYGPRVAAIHVKDIAPEGANLDEDGWADIGTGVVDWTELLTTARDVAPNALLIAEHDKPSDPRRFAKASIDALHTL